MTPRQGESAADFSARQSAYLKAWRARRTPAQIEAERARDRKRKSFGDARRGRVR